MKPFDTLVFSYEEAVVLYSMLEQMEPHAFTDDENWIMIRTSDFISDCEDTFRQNLHELYNYDSKKNTYLQKGFEKMTMKNLEDGTGFTVIEDDGEPEAKTHREPPKYSLGDRVVFETARKRATGVIHIVDAYGTFFDDSEPFYDIYSEYDMLLYKHVPESKIAKKIEVGVYHKPKFSCGDMVTFEVVVNVESWAKKQVTGIIHVVDAYGEYFNETEPAYKIYSEDDNATYRVLESEITSKVINTTC